MEGGNSCLIVYVTGLPTPISITFLKTRWHQFTSKYACPASWVHEAYFRVVEVPSTEALDRFLIADRARVKPYKELHHYRVFLDETGCHEVFAESLHAN